MSGAQMPRRASLAAFAALAAGTTASAQPIPRDGLEVVMLVHPGMILLDLVAPMTVFNLMGATLRLAWKDLSPVATDVGLPVTPNSRLVDLTPGAPILFLPGGLGGSVALMDDPEVLGFLAAQGTAARWVTSVCTGSLVLGAAGLLRGHRATSHWYVRDLLPLMGATMATDRVVLDGNRMTGGGATAGVDFGLRLAAEIGGEALARRIGLVLEYAPDPPFGPGSPEASPGAVPDVLARRAPVLATARAAALRAQHRLGT
jgi:cyclohexyl-isocyanide hydratase